MIRRILIVTIGSALLSTTAWADRAVAPTETLKRGTIETNVGFRDENLSGVYTRFMAPFDVDQTTRSLGVSVRAWLWRQLAVAADQSVLMNSRKTINVSDWDSTQTDYGLGVFSLSATGFWRKDALVVAVRGSIDRALSGTRQAIAPGATVIVGYRIAPRVELFTAPELVDDRAEGRAKVTARLGVNGRAAMWSIVPAISGEHAFASSDMTFPAYDALRADTLVAWEPRRGLTVMLDAAARRIGPHALFPNGSITAIADLSLTFTVGYAWDVNAIRHGWLQSKAPVQNYASLEVVDVSGGDAATTEALEHAIPRMRRATLDAEYRAGGGLRGDVQIDIHAADGAVTSATVVHDDLAGVDGLADALTASLAKLALPAGTPGDVRFTVRFY